MTDTSLPKRSCGACDKCCTTHAVFEIRKGEGVPCKYLSKLEGGCGIYGVHPQSCRRFRCAWLEGFTPLDARPDQVGYTMSWTVSGKEEIPYLHISSLADTPPPDDVVQRLLADFIAYYDLPTARAVVTDRTRAQRVHNLAC